MPEDTVKSMVVLLKPTNIWLNTFVENI